MTYQSSRSFSSSTSTATFLIIQLQSHIFREFNAAHKDENLFRMKSKKTGGLPFWTDILNVLHHPQIHVRFLQLKFDWIAIIYLSNPQKVTDIICSRDPEWNSNLSKCFREVQAIVAKMTFTKYALTKEMAIVSNLWWKASGLTAAVAQFKNKTSKTSKDFSESLALETLHFSSSQLQNDNILKSIHSLLAAGASEASEASEASRAAKETLITFSHECEMLLPQPCYE